MRGTWGNGLCEGAVQGKPICQWVIVCLLTQHVEILDRCLQRSHCAQRRRPLRTRGQDCKDRRSLYVAALLPDCRERGIAQDEVGNFPRPVLPSLQLTAYLRQHCPLIGDKSPYDGEECLYSAE